MGKRDDRGDGELPLEAQRDVADDQEQRDDDGEDGAPRDLTAEARGDVLDAERVGLDGLLEIGRQLAVSSVVSVSVRIWKLW